MSTTPLKILALSGSFRAGSFNSALLREAAKLAPAGVEIALYDYSAVPLYNGDLRDDAALAPVEALKGAIAAADAVLISTAEYNYSIPGPLKNALDWASRPAYKSVFSGKPVGVLGAAMGSSGSSRAQSHLRDVLFGMVAVTFAHPEFLVPAAHRKFDGEGNLTDQATRDFLEQYLAKFATWIRKQQS